MKKLILAILLLALLICVLSACNFVSEGIVESKYNTPLDYRIVVVEADGKSCVYVTDSLAAWESLSIGDEFHYVVLGAWKPSAETIYI